MKISFLIKLKENQYKIEKGNSNYVELKKVKEFTNDLKFLPEISALTFITVEKELPLIYDKKEYFTEILDPKTLRLSCDFKDFNEDLEFEYRCQGIDIHKVNEYLEKTQEIFPMFLTLDIEDYDMYTNDYDIVLEEIVLDSGKKVHETIIDYYNRCNQ